MNFFLFFFRSMTDYKTVRSSELKEVLAKARLRSEKEKEAEMRAEEVGSYASEDAFGYDD